MRGLLATLLPNIVYFLADDMGWNDVGFNGASDIITPTIDALAEDGIILERFYVQPFCTPTRCAFMTGRYPVRYGMQSETIGMDEPYGLPLTETLLPEELQGAGYSTHLIGKWHLGFYHENYLPTNRGFDSFYGYYGDGIEKYNHTKSYKKGPGNRLEGYDFRDGLTPITGNKTHVNTLLTERALDIIDEQYNSSDPFFIYMSYSNPHTPIDPEQEFVDWYNDSAINDTERVDYNALVSQVDDSISQIVEKIKSYDLWNNTIIVFSSDNGPALYRVQSSAYPLRGAKSGLFEGAVRSPAFINGGYLNDNRRGTIYKGRAHMTDWLPTFASIAGIDTTSSELDGNDLSNLILNDSGNVDNPRKEILINDDSQNYRCNNTVTLLNGTVLGNVCGALISGKYKIVIGFQASAPIEEYNGWGDNGVINNGTNATIQCNGTRPEWAEAVLNAPLADEDEGALYNLSDDPCEYEDIKSTYWSIYEDLLIKLFEYNQRAVSPLKGQTDAEPGKANPDNNGGWWSSWW